jgi:hypothetical protein
VDGQNELFPWSYACLFLASCRHILSVETSLRSLQNLKKETTPNVLKPGT